MDNIKNAIKAGLGGFKKKLDKKIQEFPVQIGVPKEPVAPIPKPDVLTPALVNFYKQDAAKASAAQEANKKMITIAPPEQVPTTIPMAAISQKVEKPKGITLVRSGEVKITEKPNAAEAKKKSREEEVIKTIREQRPQYKGSDNDIRNLYRRVGERLLSEIVTGKKQEPVEPVSNPNEQINSAVQDFLENTVFPITRKYNIPDAVAAGQFAAEGRLTGTGAERNNFFNVMAYDGKEDAMPGFDTPEQGVEKYARVLARDRRYSKAMRKSDPAEMIKAIKEAGYATRPDYAEFIMQTPEFKKYYRK